jgi:hypothetical protein
MITPEQNPTRIIRALEYLRDQGMNVVQLRELHPTRKHDEGFGNAIRYRMKPPLRGYVEPTVTYHKRLLMVEARHRDGAGAFAQLVAEAQRAYPGECG